MHRFGDGNGKLIVASKNCQFSSLLFQLLLLLQFLFIAIIFFLQESQIIQSAVGIITLSHMIKQIIQFKQQVGFDLDPYVLFRSSCIHCLHLLCIFFVLFFPFIIYSQNINAYSAVASNKQTEALASMLCLIGVIMNTLNT